MGVSLQQRSRHGRSSVLLDCAEDNVGAVFAPCHGEQTAGRHEIGHAESNGRGGHIVAFEFLTYAVTCLIAKQHKAAIARRLTTRLVESNSAIRRYFAKGDIDTAFVCNRLLVLLAVVVHCLLCDCRIYCTHVFGSYVVML